jgi:hypothetical protein
MLERGQRQPGLRRLDRVAALDQAVQHARGKGIARADPVDDAGDHDLVGLVRAARVSIAPRRGDCPHRRHGAPWMRSSPAWGKRANAASAASRRRSDPSPEKSRPSSSEMSR